MSFLSLSLGELSGSRVRADYFGNRSVLGEARSCLRQNKLTFVTHAHEISATICIEKMKVHYQYLGWKYFVMMNRHEKIITTYKSSSLNKWIKTL